MSENRDRPMLSVIVPLYQSVATVAETVRSALADEVEGGVEVVVVDDGSTDGGPRMVGEIVRRDGRVRMVHQTNGGLAAARNAGIAEARGAWLRFLDADDLAVDGGAGRLIRFAELKGYRVVCGAQELIDEHGAMMGRTLPALAGPDGTIGAGEFLESNRCGVGTVLIRREALGSERFDASLRVCEDWDLWARLAAGGVHIGVLPGPAVKLYRVRRASLSKDFAGMLMVGRTVMGRAFARARELRIDGVDVSHEREVGARARLALEWATMRALGDAENRTTEAAEMFRFGGGIAFDAKAAAGAAHWGALLGLGIRPERPGLARDVWLRRTRAWWATCCEMGWLRAADAERAWGYLADLAAAPAEVARACVAAARGEGTDTIVIYGAGVNGRAVARATLGQGLRPVYRDDRIDDGTLRADALEGVETQRMDAPHDERCGVVVSAFSDDRIVGRLAGRLADLGVWATRWRSVLQAVARSLEKELRSDSLDLRLGRGARSTVVQPMRAERTSTI